LTLIFFVELSTTSIIGSLSSYCNFDSKSSFISGWYSFSYTFYNGMGFYDGFSVL